MTARVRGGSHVGLRASRERGVVPLAPAIEVATPMAPIATIA